MSHEALPDLRMFDSRSINYQIEDQCYSEKIINADSKDFTSVMVLPIEVGQSNYRESELP